MSSEAKLGVKSGESPLSSLKGILGLISFSTIVPLNIHTTIEEMASFTWIWPLIGGLIGILVGAVGFALVNIIHLYPLVSAGLIYSFAIWFTGFHHLDGLLDVGDALMVHGNAEKRIEVMRDGRIGTGGLAYLLMVALITFSSIAVIPAALIFSVLFLSEISAKLGLVACCTFANPYSNGTGKFFMNAMNLKLLILILIITLAIGFLVLKTTGMLGIIAGLIAGMIMAAVANMRFGSATGDVLGASNEISRMISLVIMVLALVWAI